jgi:putative nucleotidyltransferase with HDIG domain
MIAGAQLAGSVAVLTAAALTGATTEWPEVELFLLLLAFGVVSDNLILQGRGVRISGSFSSLVLAMVLLGPLLAAAMGIAIIAIDAVRTRPDSRYFVSNLFAYAAFPVVGALLYETVEPAVTHAGELAQGLVIVAVFMATNILNFLMIAGYAVIADGSPLMARIRNVLMPLLPSQLATGALTACVVALYERWGMTSIALLGVVLLVFQYLLKTTLESVERADELEQRSRDLARLQVGLITTVLRTLSLRDKMTARHSAAVARYAREMARHLGLDENEQDRIHTAALLHDIGKFIFPDSILLSDKRLTNEEFEIVKRHPEQGARIVRRIEGYEDIAEIILSHHERFEGGGYPFGISGEQIPLGARIIAVADTYDVMTARDSYRVPVTPAEAMAEIRRVSGSQLDPMVVGAFLELMEARGVMFRHTDDSDFEAELAFEELVRDYAEPRSLVAS